MIYLIIETIKKRTNQEIDINEKNKEGDSAIILSIKMKNFELFKTLLEMRGLIEKDMIFTICEYSNETFLKYCLSKEFKDKYNIEYQIEALDSNKASLLHYAAKQCDSQLCEYLMENGININSRDQEGNIPMIYSLKRNNMQFLQFLIERGSKIPENLYEESIKAGASNVVSFLIENGINVNKTSQKENTSLYLLTKFSQNLEIANMLLKHGYSLKKELNSKTDIFYYSIKHKNPNIKYIEFLLKNGININFKYTKIKMKMFNKNLKKFNLENNNIIKKIKHYYI